MAELKGMLYRKLKKVIDGRRKEKKGLKKVKVSSRNLTRSSKGSADSINIMDIVDLVKVQLICFIISVLIATIITSMLPKYDVRDRTLLTIAFMSSLGTAYVILNSMSSKIILR